MKILDNVIKFGKAFQSLSQIGQVAVVIALIAIAFNFGSCEGDKKIKQFVVKYEQLQTEAVSAKLFADSAKNKIASLSNDVNSKNEVIKKLTFSVELRETQRNELRRDLVDLEKDLVVAKDTAELVVVQGHIIDNLKSQLNVADSTMTDLKKLLQLERYKVSKLDSAVALANARGDRLQTVVDSLIKLPAPKAPRNWISKKTIGIVAFAGGVFVGDYLARR
jgi:hypothetical protein